MFDVFNDEQLRDLVLDRVEQLGDPGRRQLSKEVEDILAGGAAAHEIGDRHAEGSRDAREGQEGRVYEAPLKLGHEPTAEAGLFDECIE